MRTVCIWDLQCFQSFRNCCLFCTLWLIRNFYSGHEQHVNYGKHSLNDHYQQCAHCAYDIYSMFKVFEMAVCFAHFSFNEIATPEMRNMVTMANIVFISYIAHTVYTTFTLFSNFSKLRFVLHILASSKFELRWFSPCLLWWTFFKSSFHTLRTLCIWYLQCFETFRNCCLFCTFWHILNFYSGEAHHANYSKHSSNHHFQHCAQCVYETYRVFKVFQIANSFAHFSFYETSTPVMCHMLTMANIF